MPEDELQKHEDAEIIEERVVSSPQGKYIKIKIKERISNRKHKTNFSFGVKILILFLAVVVGFIIGSRFVSKYLLYWKKAQIQYHTEEDAQSQQLKAGEVYSLSQ